jgi:hypothetical protein
VVYNFNKHFAWRIYLTGLPPDAVLEEERQRYAQPTHLPTTGHIVAQL